MHRGPPASWLHILDESGHFGHIEQRREFADAVLRMSG